MNGMDLTFGMLNSIVRRQGLEVILVNVSTDANGSVRSLRPRPSVLMHKPPVLLTLGRSNATEQPALAANLGQAELLSSAGSLAANCHRTSRCGAEWVLPEFEFKAFSLDCGEEVAKVTASGRVWSTQIPVPQHSAVAGCLSLPCTMLWLCIVRPQFPVSRISV